MSQYNLLEMKEKLKQELKAERYEHTIEVMYTAAALAMKYGEDIEKALVAGILHDCAKSVSTNLLHAKVGAQMAREVYGVEEESILNAISYHTTGRPKMTKLEKIIFVADYIEPNRKKAPNLKILRQVAFEDLERCVYMITKATLEYLKQLGIEEIDPLTEETYLYYKERMQ